MYRIIDLYILLFSLAPHTAFCCCYFSTWEENYDRMKKICRWEYFCYYYYYIHTYIYIHFFERQPKTRKPQPKTFCVYICFVVVVILRMIGIRIWWHEMLLGVFYISHVRFLCCFEKWQSKSRKKGREKEKIILLRSFFQMNNWIHLFVSIIPFNIYIHIYVNVRHMFKIYICMRAKIWN